MKKVTYICDGCGKEFPIEKICILPQMPRIVNFWARGGKANTKIMAIPKIMLIETHLCHECSSILSTAFRTVDSDELEKEE